jgi:hypothetical protein
MRTRFLSIGFALGAILIAGIARAAVPSEISIQGVLRNNQGQLQTMPVDIKIEFFDAESGGTSIAGPYTKNALVVTNGLFNVQISDATLATKLGNASAVWVEVTVNNTDVFPRQKVTSEAFALRAAVAEGLSCSGCVSNGMIAGVDGSKVSGAVATATNASQLGGVAASAYQRALGGTAACTMNQAISGIAQAGTFTCTDTVANAVNATTAGNATQLGGIAASSYQRALSATGAVSGTGTCAAGSAISGIAANGTYSCTNAIGTATSAATATSADGIRGFGVASTTPTTGQYLRFSGGQWSPANIQLGDLPSGVVSNVLPVTSGGSIYTVTVSKTAAGARFDIFASCNSPSDLLLNGGCYNNNFLPVPITQNVGIMGDGTTTKAYWYCSWDSNTTSGPTQFYAVANCYKR